jgi:hypothetical protein
LRAAKTKAEAGINNKSKNQKLSVPRLTAYFRACRFCRTWLIIGYKLNKKSEENKIFP